MIRSAVKSRWVTPPFTGRAAMFLTGAAVSTNGYAVTIRAHLGLAGPDRGSGAQHRGGAVTGDRWCDSRLCDTSARGVMPWPIDAVEGPWTR